MARVLLHKYLWQLLLLVISILMIAYTFVLKKYVIAGSSLTNHATQFEEEIKKRVNDFNDHLLTDTTLINRLVNTRESEAQMLKMWGKPYYFFLYKYGKNNNFLRFWNTAQILPPANVLNDEREEFFSKLSNGYYYILQKKLPADESITAFCMILIKSEYFIPTEYLKQSFPFDNNIDNLVDITLDVTAYPVKSPSGKTLFYLKHKPNAQFEKDNEFSVTLRLVGLFLLFLSIYFIVHERFSRQNVFKDIYIFIACMLAFRLVLYFFKSGLNLGDFKLFDPQIYHSGIFLPNLGDLLINSILFCAVAGFIWNRTISIKLGSKWLHIGYVKWILGVISLFVLVFATFTIAGIIKSLVADSALSFDVTNFFSLNIFTVVGFIILASLSLGYYYFSRILFRISSSVFKNRGYLVYFIIAIVGLFFSTLYTLKLPTSINFYISCLIWLLLYTAFFLNEHRFNSLFSINLTGVVVWIFIFSVSISILMLKEISKKELLQRKLYVEKLANQNDEASQRVVNLSNKYLDSDFLKNNFSRLYVKRQNNFLRDSIIKSSYISYLNNYTTSLFIYDSLNRPLYNPNNIALETLNTILTTQSSPTLIPDMYFYESGYDKFSYITRRKIIDVDGKLIGTVIIFSDPKKFGTGEINAEIFKQYGQWELSHPSVYYYAVYENKLLVASSKKYPFTSTLIQSEIPTMRFEERQKKGYSELWYRPTTSTVVVMSRRSEPMLEMITLFSYIFCSFLILLAVINLLLLFIDWLLNVDFFRRRNIFQSTIRGQIHNTFILITLLSFIVVGIATVSFFIDRFRVANNERLGRTMNVMLNELQSRADISKMVFEERLKLDSLNYSSRLNDIIKEVSDIHGMDLNVYDISGNLLGSSLPDLYQKGVIGTRLGPRSYYNLLRLRSIEYIQKESISELTYTSIYTPLRDDKGALFAFMSVPYFTSQHELNQEISNFLITLINLNAFIFLITGMVALLITNRITRSFKLISDKINVVSLSKENELIKWNKDDEIGSLVKEYNKMVVKLHDSANELARSERQNAWQEMARQVAHEIKNPLTPMKLNLQYLQRAINENRPDIDILAAKVSTTLVEQIDHLSKIATDFSQFANIGTVYKEIFDLHQILFQLNELHTNNPDVDFIWQPLKQELNIHADKTQINRLFTNLIVNAIDASSDNAKAIIKIHEKLDDGFVIIGVEDNGTGISDDMKNKIFIPNFTTKTSGTGLGLAMSKAIVEQSHGAIWFDTKVGVGTTFYVRLPLVPS